MAMRGLIIANKDYKNEEFINLPNVAKDSEMMDEMLGRHDCMRTLQILVQNLKSSKRRSLRKK